MLSLSKPIHKRLAEEFRFAADNMANNPDLGTKLYFFSAFFGELNRVLNQSWSPELALVHLVIQSVHQQISGRANMPTAGVIIPPEYPDALDKVADALARLFEDERIDEARLKQLLERAAELGYMMTGNGYYLYRRGEISL